MRPPAVRLASLVAALLLGCGPSALHGGDGNGGGGPDANRGGGGSDAAQGSGADAAPTSFTIYAHSDHVLYRVDLVSKSLDSVGPFNAPQVPVGNSTAEDIITDLAVGPDNKIWVISETALYTADPGDGHVTKVGSLSECGTKTVALTATRDGKIYAGDYSGAICRIDITQSPPVVEAPVTLSGNLALSGDMVAVGDGTVYGTAYVKGTTGQPDLLITVDPATGTAQSVGSSGFPKLFGASFGLGKVFGFTHDGTGDVVTIDRNSGVGTLYATFTDPTSGNGIRFAGAGVNASIVVN